MKAVFMTRTIRPRSTAQMIPGSQTLRPGRPTRTKAVRRMIGCRKTDSAAAGAAAGVHAAVDRVAAGAGRGAAEVATFRVAAGSHMDMATAIVGGLAIRMANPDSTRGQNGKGRLS